MTTSDLTGLVHESDLLNLQLPSKGPRTDATSGSPEQFSLTLFDDGRVRLGVWECTPGSFPAAKDGVGEHGHIIAGDATLHGTDGTSVELRPGVTFVTPDGWSGSWEIRETVRKVFMVWPTR
jgi:uncharacterized cupin superfamily protein